MPAGKKRTRVTIQKNTPTASSSGEKTDNWADFAERWATVEPTDGGEEFHEKRQLKAERTYRVTVRSDEQTRQIAAKNFRLTMGGQTLYVTRAFDPDMRRRDIEMEAMERI